MPPDAKPSQTDFGYRTVPRADKARLVGALFDRVAGRYDLMNDLMSGGIHRLWKREMVGWLAPRPGMHVLDLAGGTGDIALRIARRGAGRVTVCDLSPAMIGRGRDRLIDRGVIDGIDWICGTAEALPFAAATADAYTIAFGIRNFTDIAAALAEAHRVVKPGGRFLCLEFSRVDEPTLRRLYDLYSFRVLPPLGGFVAGDRDAYQYLAESIRRFPDQTAFAGMIAAAGFAGVRVRNLAGGIAALHSAWRV